MPHITLATQAKPNDDLLFQNVGGNAVLLDLVGDSCFGLNETVARLWTLLAQNSSLQVVFDALRAEYDVKPEQLQSDIFVLVDEMAKVGLTQVR